MKPNFEKPVDQNFADNYFEIARLHFRLEADILVDGSSCFFDFGSLNQVFGDINVEGAHPLDMDGVIDILRGIY